MRNEVKSGGSDCYASREKLVELVKRDVRRIASIYPSAFDLYDEPLDRLARRIVHTFETHNKEVSGGRSTSAGLES